MDERIRRLYNQGSLSEDMVTYLENQEMQEYQEVLWERERYSPDGYYSNEYEENPLSDEEIDRLMDQEYRKKLNLARDERGRLLEGAVIAKKRQCDEEEIWSAYSKFGLSVKEIVETRGCSKSTVYNVIKKYREKERT